MASSAVSVTPAVTGEPVATHVTAPGIVPASYGAALSLASVSAFFSITGMTSIFIGAFWPVIAMGVALEVGKLCAVAWLGHHSGVASWRLRAALGGLVAVLMGLNAIGAYGFLAATGNVLWGDFQTGGIADVYCCKRRCLFHSGTLRPAAGALTLRHALRTHCICDRFHHRHGHHHGRPDSPLEWVYGLPGLYDRAPPFPCCTCRWNVARGAVRRSVSAATG